MKRFLSILTALMLTLSLGAPALAEENASSAATAESETETVAGVMIPASTAEPSASPTGDGGMDDALTAITLAVKNTLGVSDNYTSFTGNYNEYVQNTWSLDWSGTNGSLDVTADGQGKVLSAYYYLNSTSANTFGGFDPRLPTQTDEAEKAASDWLSKLMGEGETARITATNYSLNGSGSYDFSGTVLLNGLDSPVTFSICVGADLSLQSYSRSDANVGYLGDVPGTDAAASQNDASDLLKAAVKLELYYVSDGENAALTYVPCGPTTIVDAATGQSVDMDALYASFTGSGYAPENGATAYAEDSASGGATLTPVEESSISNYDGVMDKSALDEMVRSISSLGVDDGFTLRDCTYSLDNETGNISAALRYAKAMTGDDLYGYTQADYDNSVSSGCTMDITKYITLDAKTGALIGVSTDYPLTDKDAGASLGADVLAADADAFLKTNASDHYADTALCTLSGYDTTDGYTYAREANGYFFPENYLYVSLNAAAGTVDSFSSVWDDDMQFATADQIVDEAAAEDAYIGALTVTLGYTAWPESVDYTNPLFDAAANWGYTWVESLKLVYYYAGTDAVSGVDAATGKVQTATDGSTVTYTYDDIDSSPRKSAIEALGAAGVGLSGEKFQPRAAITQRVAAELLLQACGYSDAADWDDDTLGREAAYMGFISASDWNPDSWMTRMDFLRAMIGASPYGKAAALTGVWSVSYSDAGSVDAGDLGFAAVAQALGVVTDGNLSPAITCTRAFAAQVLYNYMTRV